MAWPVPVQALHLWPVSLGLLAPVAMGTRCPSSRQSHAGLVLDMVFSQCCLFTWDHAPHAPRSAGQSGAVAALPAHQPVLPEQLLVGGIGQTPVGKEVPGSSGAGEEASGRKSWVGWG